jgi:hypothetical protein
VEIIPVLEHPFVALRHIAVVETLELGDANSFGAPIAASTRRKSSLFVKIEKDDLD